MLVRSVKQQGVFRWKKHDVFLSEVLWGECIGLLPRDERWSVRSLQQTMSALVIRVGGGVSETHLFGNPHACN
jgi:hypothetical protein